MLLTAKQTAESLGYKTTGPLRGLINRGWLKDLGQNATGANRHFLMFDSANVKAVKRALHGDGLPFVNGQSAPERVHSVVTIEPTAEELEKAYAKPRGIFAELDRLSREVAALREDIAGLRQLWS